MLRRRLLETIAAGGILGGTVWGIAANATTTQDGAPADSSPRQVPVEGHDALYVLADGEVQRIVENPTDDAFRRLQESLGPGERISSSEVGTDCMTYCEEDCDVFCPDSKCYPSHSCATDEYCCRETTSDTTGTDSTAT